MQKNFLFGGELQSYPQVELNPNRMPGGFHLAEGLDVVGRLL